MEVEPSWRRWQTWDDGAQVFLQLFIGGIPGIVATAVIAEHIPHLWSADTLEMLEAGRNLSLGIFGKRQRVGSLVSHQLRSSILHGR